MSTLHIGKHDLYVGRDHVGWVAAGVLALTCAYADSQPAPITEESEISYPFPEGEAPPPADAISSVWADEWQLPPEPTGYRILAAVTPPPGDPPLYVVLPDPDPEPETDESFVGILTPEAAADEGLLIAVGNDADPDPETDDSFAGHVVEEIFDPVPTLVTDDEPGPETDESYALSEIAEIFDPVLTLVTDDEPDFVTDESEYSSPFEDAPTGEPAIIESVWADEYESPPEITYSSHLARHVPLDEGIIQQALVSEEAPEPETEDSWFLSEIAEIFDPVDLEALVSEEAPEPETEDSWFLSEIAEIFDPVDVLVTDEADYPETEDSWFLSEIAEIFDPVDVLVTDEDPAPETEDSATVYSVEDVALDLTFIPGVVSDEWDELAPVDDHLGLIYEEPPAAPPEAPVVGYYPDADDEPTTEESFVGWQPHDFIDALIAAYVDADDRVPATEDSYFVQLFDPEPASAPIVATVTDDEPGPTTEESHFLSEIAEIFDPIPTLVTDDEPGFVTEESEYSSPFEAVPELAPIVGTVTDADPEPETEDSYTGEPNAETPPVDLTFVAGWQDDYAVPPEPPTEEIDHYPTDPVVEPPPPPEPPTAPAGRRSIAIPHARKVVAHREFRLIIVKPERRSS